MTTTDLKKRIAEVLGVSATQSEIAFEIFFENLSQVISEGITLKIPRVGYFQLKPNEKNQNQIIFAPLPEDYSATSKNLFLTFDLYQKNKNSFEIDSQVFSIGVGKPLLPLVKDDSDFDAETSFEILKKSIEERTKELLSESDQIPNYNIWDDFALEENNSDEEINLSDFSFPQNNFIDKPTTEEKLLESLLSQQDFKIENDFHEDELKVDYELPEFNHAELDLTVNESLSVDDLLDDDLTKNEVESIQKEESEIENNQEHEIDIESNQKYESSFAEELKNQLEELEKSTEEFINETVEEAVVQESIQNDEAGIPPTEIENDFSDLINIEEENDEEQKEEQKLISETEEEYTSNQKDDYSIIPQEESGENISEELKLLLEENNIVEEKESEEIHIVPPASAKEFIVDEIEFNKSSSINIEDDALKEIINIELNTLEQDQSKEEHSNVLANLLAEEKIPDSKEDLSITKDDSESDAENEEPVVQNIEWNWGDELKEEFGIGKGDEEIEINAFENYDVNIEQAEPPKSDEFEIGEPEFIIPPTIELKKTRVDLFTKLEETLEKEINFLRDEIDDKTKESYQDDLKENEIHFEKPEIKESEEKEPKIEFTDEKVILDFKTPPPKYEFIQEKPEPIINENPEEKRKEEPILKPPKRITIILSPEEQENLKEKKTITKTVAEDEVAEVEIIQQPKPKKNYWKLISISLSILVVISVAAILFLTQFNKKNNYTENKTSEKVTSGVNEISQQTTANQSDQQLKSVSDLPVDEYSDFPISATPPKPIQSGNEINVEQLIPKTNVAEQKPIQIPVKEKIQKQEPVTEKKSSPVEQKPLVTNKNNKSNSASEIRLSNMIFFDGKSYSFQTSSWKNKALAEAEVNRLRSIGFNAFLVQAYLPQKGGTWYRVRIGSFGSEQEALEFMKKNNF